MSSTTKQLNKLINKTSNKHCLNIQYSIEHLLIELNKLYLQELLVQKQLDNKYSTQSIQLIIK